MSWHSWSLVVIQLLKIGFIEVFEMDEWSFGCGGLGFGGLIELDKLSLVVIRLLRVGFWWMIELDELSLVVTRGHSVVEGWV